MATAKDHICHKEEIIASIDKTINGNGQPGLRDTVVKLTILVEKLNERLEKMDNARKFNITSFISICALAVAIYAILIG